MSEKVARVSVGVRAAEVPVGTTVAEVLGSFGLDDGTPSLGVFLDNRLVSLNSEIRGDCDLVPVSYNSRAGAAIYRTSAALILYQAMAEIFPEVRLSVGQSLFDGYFFEWEGEEAADEEAVARVAARMREIVAEDRPFRNGLRMLEDAIEVFEAAGRRDVLDLLETWPSSVVNVGSCGSNVEIRHGPLAPSTGCIEAFELVAYPPGIVLRFPDMAKPTRFSVIHEQSKLFRTYRETRRWDRILGVSDLGGFNRHILEKGAGGLIRVAEGLHEKKVVEIADAITARKDEIRLVLIAGPSSSGKTTFAKRLSVQLRVNGIEPVGLSLDNYYVDREKTPLGDDGEYDFEALEAIDLALFNEQLAALMRGKEVHTPRFDFASGRRKEGDGTTMRLGSEQILMVEGIHALNDRLTESVPGWHKHRIYVSALSQLSLDRHNRLFTSDARFVRRIVRDKLYRGYRAEQTIAMWPRVRLGEERHIFPFQERADVMFNSALVYEPAVLRLYAERFLLEVPRDDPAYADAFRLRRFLQLFVPVFPSEVPHTSILREFIGGSTFSY